MPRQVNKDLNDLIYSANRASHVAINILYLVAEHMKEEPESKLTKSIDEYTGVTRNRNSDMWKYTGIENFDSILNNIQALADKTYVWVKE